jgi:hypothetical protein
MSFYEEHNLLPLKDNSYSFNRYYMPSFVKHTQSVYLSTYIYLSESILD